MERSFRGVAFALALALAAPAMAQPAVPAAIKGEVVVCLRDGRTISGAVGEWADTLGFQVIPADGVPYFVRVSDILTIRSVASGDDRNLPSRESRLRLGAGGWAAIVVGGIAAGLITLKMKCPRGCD